MLVLFALIELTFSLLSKGQDPYAILGLDKQATAQQIKAAFRAKTRKFHPDINKDPGAQKKWIQISDAFELLTDPKSKERYDKFGIIDETLLEQPKPGHNRADKIRDILTRDSSYRSKDRDYGEFDYREKKTVVTELDDKNFAQITSDGRPWVIYCYSNDYSYGRYKDVLEDLFQKTGLLFGIAKLRYSVNPVAAQKLQVKNDNEIVVYEPSALIPVSHFTGEPNFRSISRFATRKFGAEVTIVHSDEDILAWRKKNLDKIHIILFSDLRDPPTSYDLAAAFLKKNAVFAFASINQKNLLYYPRALGSLTVDELPTYIFYRMGNPKDDTFGGPVTPLVAPLDLDAGALAAIVRQYHYPVFAEVNKQNFNRLCPDYCIIHVLGAAIADDVKVGVNDMNIPTASMNITKESEIATKYGLEPGDFFVIRRRTNDYAVWKELTTWGDFRKTIEYMRNGIAKFNKLESIPEFSDAENNPKDLSISKYRDSYLKIQSKISDKIGDLIARIKKLPAILILIIGAVVFIVIGEVISYLMRK